MKDSRYITFAKHSIPSQDIEKRDAVHLKKKQNITFVVPFEIRKQSKFNRRANFQGMASGTISTN